MKASQLCANCFKFSLSRVLLLLAFLERIAFFHLTFLFQRLFLAQFVTTMTLFDDTGTRSTTKTVGWRGRKDEGSANWIHGWDMTRVCRVCSVLIIYHALEARFCCWFGSLLCAFRPCLLPWGLQGVWGHLLFLRQLFIQKAVVVSGRCFKLARLHRRTHGTLPVCM